MSEDVLSVLPGYVRCCAIFKTPGAHAAVVNTAACCLLISNTRDLSNLEDVC